MIGLRARRAGFAGLLVAVCVFLAATQPTDAAWTTSQSTRTTLSAGEVPTPEFTACTPTPGVLGGLSTLTLTWRSPGDFQDQAVRFGDANASTSGLTRTGPSNGLYTYTITYGSGLLTGILGSLLGVNVLVTIRNVHPQTAWFSDSSSWRFTTTLAGLFPNCVP